MDLRMAFASAASCAWALGIANASPVPKTTLANRTRRRPTRVSLFAFILSTPLCARPRKLLTHQRRIDQRHNTCRRLGHGGDREHPFQRCARHQGHSGLGWRRGLRPKLESELVDLAGELERRIIAMFQQGDAGSRVLADVESFVFRESDGGAMLQRIPGDLFPIHGEHTRTAVAYIVTVQLVIEDDGVLAGLEFGPLPGHALEVEQIVEEHDLAPADAEFALAQEQA